MFYGASPKLFGYAKIMREAATEAEAALWNVLNDEPFIAYKFRRQHPIATFIADFYSHKVRIVIEIDGGYHLRKEQKEYDDFRDEDMKKLGISVIRFTNQEVLKNIELVTIIMQGEIFNQNTKRGSRFSL